VTCPAQAQVCGDVDGSGTVTVSDGIETLRAAAGLTSNCTPGSCDVDGTGTVTVTDGVNILRTAAGLPSIARCPTGITKFVGGVDGDDGTRGRLEIGLAPVPQPGAPLTVAKITGTSTFTATGPNLLAVDLDVNAGAASAEATDATLTDATLVVAARDSNGSFLENFFDLPLVAPPAGMRLVARLIAAPGDNFLTLRSQDSGDTGQIAFATRIGGVLSQYASIDQARPVSGNRLTFIQAQFDGEDGVDGLDAAVAVAPSPDGAHVYVGAFGDNAVAVFRRDAGAGSLTFVEAQFDGVSGVVGLRGITSLAVSPDGAHVYTASQLDNAVAVFRRDPVTGTLTFVEAKFDNQGGVDGIFAARSVALSPDGSSVYVAGGNISFPVDESVAVFSRDPATGRLTFVEAKFDGVDGVDGLDFATSVTVSPDGANVYAASARDSAVTVFKRNAATGKLTFVDAQFDGVNGVSGLEFTTSVTVSPDGAHVYVGGASRSVVAVFRRDPTDGMLTFVAAQQISGLVQIEQVLTSRDGGFVFVSAFSSSSIAICSRDVATGVLTPIQVVPNVIRTNGLGGAAGLATSPDGTQLYVTGFVDDSLANFSLAQ